MNWAEVNGVGLRYEPGGQGRDVVVIHEMGGLLESWDAVAPKLRQHHRVLRYDTRGAGLSEKIKGALKIETMADDLASLLDHVKRSGPVVVAGVAVGAAIAVCFAARYPERTTAGLVAMSPALDVSPEQRPNRLERVTKIEVGGMRAIFEDAMSNDYPQNLRDLDPGRFTTFRARWLSNDPESFCAIMRMLIHLDLNAAMASIKCPSLVIGGAFDKGRPPAYAEAVSKKIPAAHFKVLQSGHQMQVQTPDLVTKALLEFLAALPKT